MKRDNSDIVILLWMASYGNENNARFGPHIPKNPYEQLDWQPNTYIIHLDY